MVLITYLKQQGTAALPLFTKKSRLIRLQVQINLSFSEREFWFNCKNILYRTRWVKALFFS